jgi:putative Mg2+ transporter-C (MgtC) family protein
MGAGLIFRGQGGVHGLTTAAASWAVAAMAILVGSGELLIGVAMSAVILLILELDRLPGLRAIHSAANGRGPEPPSPAAD